jgi:hypothetical protein
MQRAALHHHAADEREAVQAQHGRAWAQSEEQRTLDWFEQRHTLVSSLDP